MAPLLLGMVVLVAVPVTVAAHDLELTTTVVLLRPDDRFRVDVTCDLDALALGVPIGSDAERVVEGLRRLSPVELRERIARLRDILNEEVDIRFDGRRPSMELSFPEYQSQPGDRPTVPTVLGLTARFTGPIPHGARSFTFGIDPRFPPVFLTAIDERTTYISQQVLPRGVASDPFPVGSAGSSDAPPPRPSGWRYLWMGVTHIVPEGLDHMLFVLALFLLTPRVRSLLWQVSAFTLAHTVTLALSSYGLVRLPATVVEPLIAVSIAYVAIENLFTDRLTPSRPVVVFLFGLLHGLGFAGALGELLLPREGFLTALVGFNAGVELGQVVVLLGAWLAIGWFRERSWYRSRVTVPLTLAIAATGIFWAVERSFFT